MQKNYNNGLQTEFMFQAICLKYNMDCHRPIIGNLPYDFLVNGIDDSKKHRKIQVKKSYIRKKGNKSKRDREIVTLSRTAGLSYKIGDFDYLVVNGKDGWYVLPYKIIKKNKKTVDINKEKWLQYKMNWTL